MKPGRNDPCLCGDEYHDEQELIINAINNLRRFILDKKPHIKEYYKIRNLHGEIVNAMIQYHHEGKFKRKIDTDFVSESERGKTVYVFESNFDLKTREGGNAFYDMLIYKTTSNMSCITDDFIRNRRYKKPEKTEFLHSMLDSKLGLFEVTGTEMEEGYAYIKNVFTGDEYKIIDIGLSGEQYYDDYFFYTRIITYQGINFNAGLNFIFTKNDSFIKNHIRQHRKDFDQNWEFQRFIQLYNHYSKYPDKVKLVTNKL